MGRKNFSGRTSQAKAGFKRLKDARKLRDLAGWRGSMYLAGYYIECRLKARLMEMYGIWTLEELETRLSQRTGKPVRAFTHSIEVLMTHTGALSRMDGKVRRSFAMCNQWKTDWRYDPDECETFIEAVEILGRFIDRSI
ncbi:MAG: hypothetical protein DRI57_33365 [Deltaproteobacteria bacterium]|nr:MAG: hypothetical protein DRI57_33365 [Deltaproteobacteria bacterium]